MGVTKPRKRRPPKRKVRHIQTVADPRAALNEVLQPLRDLVAKTLPDDLPDSIRSEMNAGLEAAQLTGFWVAVAQVIDALEPHRIELGVSIVPPTDETSS